MNHKKRYILFFTITFTNLNRFLKLLYHFNHEEILHTTYDCSKIYHITLIVCAPYFVKEHFSVKTLLFFVHLLSQQKRTEKVISSHQFHIVAISNCYLTVAIISNVQNVRLQRQYKPTDDASTRRWRGSQQTGSVRTARRSDARAARRHPWLFYGTHDACPVLYIFFRFRQCKHYWNLLRFDRVAVKCTLLRFMNHCKNVGFNFSR